MGAFELHDVMSDIQGLEANIALIARSLLQLQERMETLTTRLATMDRGTGSARSMEREDIKGFVEEYLRKGDQLDRAGARRSSFRAR